MQTIYVMKRPGVDEFLVRLAEFFEIIIFTASIATYADSVLDVLDKHKVITHRLYREHCVQHKGIYVKVQLFNIGFIRTRKRY